jgi:lysozyme
MDRSRLEAQLTRDEGLRFTVYADTRGVPTVGIGHLVLRGDHLTLGDPVTPEQVAAWFHTDLNHALAACQTLFPTWATCPETVQEILANMAFNLGTTRLARFRDLRAAVARHDWEAAADAMVDSARYHQVGERSKRLVSRHADGGGAGLVDFKGFIGASSTTRSPHLDSQKCVNLYAEMDESGQGKNVAALYGTPGLSRFCTLPAAGGVRGLVTASGGRCFAVCGAALYELFAGGTSLDGG